MRDQFAGLMAVFASKCIIASMIKYPSMEGITRITIIFQDLSHSKGIPIMATALPRSKVKKNQTWNAESVFASPEAFNVEVENLVESLASVKAFQGRLTNSPAIFLEAMALFEAISRRAAKIQVYATMSSAVDTGNQQGAAMNGKAMSALAQVGAALSFVDPELLSAGEAKFRQWMQDDSRIHVYDHYIRDLFRRQAHVRNAEVEELMGMLRDPFGTVRSTASMLAAYGDRGCGGMFSWSGKVG